MEEHTAWGLLVMLRGAGLSPVHLETGSACRWEPIGITEGTALETLSQLLLLF